MGRRLKWSAIGIVGIALLLVGYDRVVWRLGVCHGERHVEFVVTDAETGQPIAGAEIHLQWFEETEEGSRTSPRTLQTGAGGTVRAAFGEVLYVCNESGFGLTEEITVSEPGWKGRVTAPGYAATTLEVSGSPRYGPPDRRDGPGQVLMTKMITLRRRSE